MKEQKEIGYVVTHTHWDREWRYPLWENRMYLVNLMDELLETLATNSDYKSFVLDGQSVVVEDYLQVRPERAEEIKRHIQEGRISVGPWYTLPDLYPVDGECLIRNLMKGIRFSSSLGGYLNIAYESFGWGQIAQFPQIYKGFGFDIVIVAKNVSKERAPESEFMWEGPDGTQILSTRLGQHGRANFFMNAYLKIMTGKDYLSDAYKLEWDQAGAIYHQADEKGFFQDYLKLDNTEKLHDEYIKEAVQTAWDATNETTVKTHRVLMNGSDSTTSQPMLPEIIKKANELFEDKELVLASLETYTEQLKTLVDYDKLKVVKGELRDGPAFACSANALMTRPFIKMLNKKVQNALIHMAEPLSVMSAMVGAKYDKSFLDIAIKYMLLSHPHDSINGVTQDKTAGDVLYMLNQALEISEAMSNKAASVLVKNLDTSAYDPKDILLVVLNASPYSRNEMVKVYIDTPCDYNIWDFDLVDRWGKKSDIQLISRKEVVVPVNDLHARPLPFYVDRHCFYLDTQEVPAGGYKAFKLVPKKTFNRKAVFWAEMRTSKGDEISKASNTLENEFLKVEVQNNGTLMMLDKSTGMAYKDLNYFEDTGDCGDYWMYYPPYNNQTFTSQGCHAKIWRTYNGPLSATIVAQVKLQLPSFALRPENEIRGESRRSDEEKELTATIHYTLKRHSKKVDVQLIVENTMEDHRFRVLFDTGIKAQYSAAAGHFTVDQRPVTPLMDTSGEFWPEMQTLPQQTFVDLSDGQNGFALINNCMTEFEAMDNEKGTIALTLFRSVRNIICTEFRSAGCFPHEKGGQSLGTLTYNYAIVPHSGTWETANIYYEAEQLNVPLKLVQTGKHEGGKLPPENSFFAIEPQSLVMSTFKASEDRDSYILRLFNPTHEKVEGTIRLFAPIKAAYFTNLNEERMDESVEFDAHAIFVVAESNKILTIEIEMENTK
ncbi:MAG: alpha-mannosidase [Vallitaleaceae bacterium]|nr:alpha-mannosidase [Vallitaleaceae bacterium]